MNGALLILKLLVIGLMKSQDLSMNGSNQIAI